MRCPLDEATLREVNRRGVQIDICPECKGVWLDRGELDKLMEVSEREEREEIAYERSSRGRGHDDDADRRGGRFFGDSGDSFFGDSGDRAHGRYDDDRRYVDERGRPVKKKKSWFSELMDFGGD